MRYRGEQLLLDVELADSADTRGDPLRDLGGGQLVHLRYPQPDEMIEEPFPKRLRHVFADSDAQVILCVGQSDRGDGSDHHCEEKPEDHRRIRRRCRLIEQGFVEERLEQ